LFTKLFENGSFDAISDFISLNEILSEKRPAIIISSTSYTADEDFDILLDAIKMYDDENLSKILVIVTGKGPLKEFYRAKIGGLNPTLKSARVLQLWMDIEDYPVILGSSDLGVSLHVSTSGRDLPMKVVDMFGCGIPVCALQFPCLSELVVNGENGYCFRTAAELSNQLVSLFKGFPHKADSLRNLEKGVLSGRVFQVRWRENWDTIVIPILTKIMKPKKL
jgi:beta-1,4-mannosyltransferase